MVHRIYSLCSRRGYFDNIAKIAKYVRFQTNTSALKLSQDGKTVKHLFSHRELTLSVSIQIPCKGPV
jgi:hypothetical protein